MNLPVLDGLHLRIDDGRLDRLAYPTSRLQKGLVLRRADLDLAEEGVGFGVPLLNRGIHTLFPGEVKLEAAVTRAGWTVTADYSLNLVERMKRRDQTSIQSAWFYALKNSFSAWMMRYPLVRRPLMALSRAWRRLAGWETTYEPADMSASIRMTCSFDQAAGLLAVEADLGRLPRGVFSEVIVMNEQGARCFDLYRDDAGTRPAAGAVGLWDEVQTAEAGFASSRQHVAFSLTRAPGARLFRGRELVDPWLAWAGFGYTLPPAAASFHYWLRLEELP